MASHTVIFQPVGAKAVVRPEDYPCGNSGDPGSILDIALTHGVAIEHPCGGMGACNRCTVQIDAGAENLSAPDAGELDTLKSCGASQTARLACRAIVHGDVTVTLPEE